jgi:hypothetical protein
VRKERARNGGLRRRGSGVSDGDGGELVPSLERDVEGRPGRVVVENEDGVQSRYVVLRVVVLFPLAPSGQYQPLSDFDVSRVQELQYMIHSFMNMLELISEIGKMLQLHMRKQLLLAKQK